MLESAKCISLKKIKCAAICKSEKYATALLINLRNLLQTAEHCTQTCYTTEVWVVHFVNEWPVLYLCSFVFCLLSAVLFCFEYRYKEVAKLLIESGADVTIQGNTGCRAFDIGSITGEHSIKDPPTECEGTLMDQKCESGMCYSTAIDKSVTEFRQFIPSFLCLPLR